MVVVVGGGSLERYVCAVGALWELGVLGVGAVVAEGYG